MNKVLIIEDEMPSARKLKALINTIEPEFMILDILESCAEAIHYLSENTVDLIFLDIHLADGNAFSVFDQIKVDCPIIFTTAYDQYALEAFKQNSVDYLLKPVSKETLTVAIDKYKNVFADNVSADKVDYQMLGDWIAKQEQSYRKRFMVYFRDTIRSVKVEEIAYFFAESKAVFLRTTDGKTYDLNHTLDHLEQILSPEMFFRANRKYLISINAVKEALAYSKSKLKLMLLPETEGEVFISSEKSVKFKNWLNG
ncbi:LytR/AlgR family response regulator transcription factor [Aureibacter tunicatorum]|uniref:DNA-binding LytR/AlgR family response regulator n=1 Tax=Aureibacter tunicatorum TaxID=866807 RepID=A0AAE4BT78_9BACT|nr:LytTR family DNA-binding domain-containing protein [Aureibacter tunicatorum]MDR6240506.1 DNA-binding LytR/AlgR family response regulator [Aureibacter tunicatorum]BDD06631.1 DNA-binding response regulator [Aureibacter tunicatorum]